MAHLKRILALALLAACVAFGQGTVIQDRTVTSYLQIDDVTHALGSWEIRQDPATNIKLEFVALPSTVYLELDANGAAIFGLHVIPDTDQLFSLGADVAPTTYFLWDKFFVRHGVLGRSGDNGGSRVQGALSFANTDVTTTTYAGMVGVSKNDGTASEIPAIAVESLDITANFYNRVFAGADASCPLIDDGWTGIRTDTSEIQACIGGVVVKFAAGGGVTLPVVDTTSIVKGSGDPTKTVRLEVDGLTTATTRVWTAQDLNLTVAGIDVAQTWTATQTMRTILPSVPHAWDLGSTALPWDQIFSDFVRSPAIEIDTTTYSSHWTLRQDVSNNLEVVTSVGVIMWEWGNVHNTYRSIFPGSPAVYSLGSVDFQFDQIWADFFAVEGPHATDYIALLYEDSGGAVLKLFDDDTASTPEEIAQIGADSTRQGFMQLFEGATGSQLAGMGQVGGDGMMELFESGGGGGKVQFSANGTAPDLLITMTAGANVLPATANSHDLGGTGAEWDQIFGNFFNIRSSAGTCTIVSGSGAPAGACTTCDMALRTDGGTGTTLYVCEATAWVAK